MRRTPVEGCDLQSGMVLCRARRITFYPRATRIHGKEVFFWEGKTMKKWLLIAGLCLMMTWLSGCIVIDTEKAESFSRHEVVEPEDVTIREIDAVGTLSFDNNRRDAYKRIAHRHSLSPGAQVHLVEAAFQNLAMENAKVDVLLALVHNRCFSSEAKSAVLDRLNGLAFENSGREILDAMSKK